MQKKSLILSLTTLKIPPMENNQTDNRDHRAKADENKKVQI